MGSCAQVKDCLSSNSEFTSDTIKPASTMKTIVKRASMNNKGKIKFSLDQSTDDQINPSLYVREKRKKHLSAKVNMKMTIESIVDAPRLTTKFLFQDEKDNQELPKANDIAALANPNSDVKVIESITDEEIDFIRKILTDNNLVYNFDEDTIEEFVIGFFAIEVPEEHKLFEIGQDAKAFYIIEKGSVMLTNKDGQSETLKDGNFFGIEAFDENDTAKRIQTAKSTSKSQLLGVSSEFYRSALVYMNLKEMNEKVEMIKKIILFRYLEQYKQIGLCKHLTLLHINRIQL